MGCLPTWAPGVKEQDELDPPRPAQGQRVAAYRCIRGAADGHGHHVSAGRAGDGSAPSGSVDVWGQAEGGPGAVLLMWLRTCMRKRRRRSNETFVFGKWKIAG